MIKANELRIGNIFNWDTVDSPSYFELEHFEYLDRLMPIPLTEEWLMKFGFIFDENKGFDCICDDGEISTIEDNPLWYKEYSNNKRFCVYLKRMTCHVSLKCKYLHDLQNCYFIVTGQELELK